MIDEENICLRCGGCCKIKNKINKTQYFQHNRYCKYLRKTKDGKTRCVNYSGRSNLNMCTTALIGVKIGVMPKECPYIKFYMDKPEEYVYNIKKK